MFEALAVVALTTLLKMSTYEVTFKRNKPIWMAKPLENTEPHGLWGTVIFCERREEDVQ